jgi:hypothetical protein
MTRMRVVLLVVAAAASAAGLHGAVRSPSPVAEKEFRHPGLHLDTQQLALSQLGDRSAPRFAAQISALGLDAGTAFFDPRSGRPSSLILSLPFVPGTGVGNALRATGTPGETPVREMAWSALVGYLAANEPTLGVDVSELSAPRVDVLEDAALIFIYSQRILSGIPVRDSSVTAIVNHGNLVLLGLQSWGDAGPVPAAPRIDADAARAAVVRHVQPLVVESLPRGERLEYVPMAAPARYDYRLAWAVPARIRGDLGSWEGLVDAATGELLAFVDTNAYAARRSVGGVYPVSNDQRPPDGIEQPGWPMPFLSLTVAGNPLTSTTGGTFGCPVGVATAGLSGPFVAITDGCGTINESSAGDLDYGAGPGTDCIVPPGRSAGDTYAARTAFYEVNRIAEQAAGWLPSHVWLQSPTPTTTNNPNGACGAVFNGTSIWFYRSNAQCAKHRRAGGRGRP